MQKYVTIELRGYQAPSKPDEFIKWLNDNILETGVPREDISIEIEANPDYDSSYYTSINLSFHREETPKEKQQREAEKERQEQWERNQLKKLQEKYGA